MTTKPRMEEMLRDRIISDPESVLEDQDLMRALISANERAMGGNVIDLRGVAMERLEARLDRLEDTHRSVISAAYENLAGTNQIHRAILKMLDPLSFEEFLKGLGGEVADILRVDVVKLVLETVQNERDPAITRLGDVLCVAEPGFIGEYLSQGRNVPLRQVTLRQMQQGSAAIYGEAADWIRSEACLKLDFGKGRLPGMLVFGAEGPGIAAADLARFAPEDVLQLPMLPLLVTALIFSFYANLLYDLLAFVFHFLSFPLVLHHILLDLNFCNQIHNHCSKVLYLDH